MKSRLIYWATTIVLLIGLVLTFVSSLKICSQQCAAVGDYRIFGLPFEAWGFAFFIGVFLAHLMSYRLHEMSWLVLFMLAGAFGSEVWFIYLQKFVIGHWCPICLSIALTVFIALILQMIYHIKYLPENQEVPMMTENRNKFFHVNKYFGSIGSFAAVLTGFAIAFTGISKFDKLEAAQDSLKENIVFGDSKSNIEAYLFTDWQCPSCRKIEPALEKLVPALANKAKFVFVDFPIHPETMNFTPYNLAFMVNNKDKYLELRGVLTEISKKTGTPSEEQVEKAIAPLGVKFTQLNYADVAVGFKYYKELGKQFNINSTPTLVIVNVDTKKGKKLSGGTEITETNVLNAIDNLKKGTP